jgi:hypothetical protein
MLRETPGRVSDSFSPVVGRALLILTLALVTSSGDCSNAEYEPPSVAPGNSLGIFFSRRPSCT